MMAFQVNGEAHSPTSQGAPAAANARPTPPMLTPTNAWRILCRRTGGSISRTTFYRWLSCGKIYSIRMGYRLFIPYPAVEELIKQCLAGERY